MKTGKYERILSILADVLTKIDRIEFFFEKDFNQRKVSADSGSELLTISEVAELLKLSVSTIYSKVSRSEIPAFKIGKRLYFCKHEIILWIKSGKIKTLAEIRKEVDGLF